MYCSKCGAKNTKFCHKCGNAVSAQTPVNSPAPPVPVIIAVLASLSIEILGFFFCFTYEAWHVVVTFVPALLFFMTYINVACAIPARAR